MNLAGVAAAIFVYSYITRKLFASES